MDNNKIEKIHELSSKILNLKMAGKGVETKLTIQKLQQELSALTRNNNDQ